MQNRFGIAIPVLAIFLVTLLGGAVYNYYSTLFNAEKLGQQALTRLETYIQQSALDLQQLTETISPQCSHDDVIKLRNYVFTTNKIKEVGVYNAQGNVFCTSNAGNTNIKIYSQILTRLAESENKTTISLTNSVSGLPAFYIYTSSLSQPTGVDVLIPPLDFVELIDPLFQDKAYGYQINILKRSIDGIQIEQSSSNRVLNFTSDNYPLTIVLQVGTQAYVAHFFAVSWIILLVASLIAVGFLLIRDYSRSNHSLDASLRLAIHNNQLELYLQPIVNSKLHTVVGSEALLRWNDPDKGFISPAIFIPLAEQMGLIQDLTHSVIDYLTNYYEQHKRDLQDRYISINISRTLVLDDDFISYIYDYAITNPKMVNVLVLEITEDNNYSADELVKAVHNLSLLRHLGFKTAVDDFGTGYSGLNFIHQHPFDKLKIDQVFIRSLSQNQAVDSVVLSMIDLANQLGMKVIAEGVETAEQLRVLEEMGVENIQGFFFAKPMPAEEFIGYLKNADRGI